MKPAPFEYLRPGSVEAAVAALADVAGSGEEAKILAGGQSLVPLLALRMARPSVLVDVNRIPGLSEVRPVGGRAAGATVDADRAAVAAEPGGTGITSVEVGTLVRHAALARQTAHPLLAEAARWIGHPAIRSRGTFGGSLAHADPAAELPVVAVACGAVAEVIGPSGRREVPATELFVGPLTSSLVDDEMITSVRVPVPVRWGFAEFARRHGDFALVTVGVAVFGDPAGGGAAMDGGGAGEAAHGRRGGAVSIVLGGVGGVPLRARAAEAVLAEGGSVEVTTASACSEQGFSVDLHASADYRRALAGELVGRALRQAGVGAAAGRDR